MLLHSAMATFNSHLSGQVIMNSSAELFLGGKSQGVKSEIAPFTMVLGLEVNASL